jgi:hypothetical protein
MKHLEWAYILTQRRKGLTIDQLIAKGKNTERPIGLAIDNYYLISGYIVSEWIIRQIYERPDFFERSVRFHNNFPENLVIDEEWLNNYRFVAM